MKRNSVLESVEIEKLVYGGKGLAMAPDGMKILINGGAIPGQLVDVRILKKRKSYYQGQIASIKKPSPIERELEEGEQLYGGCKWLPIPYEKQLEIKSEQVQEAFNSVREASFMKDVIFHEIVPSPEIYGYRNKVEFSWGKYISQKQDIHDEYRFGFHEQGSFDRIIDCENCVLADEVVNRIFRRFDRFARESNIPTYDQKRQEGFWRHLVIRQGKNTGQVMVVLSVHLSFLGDDVAHFKDDVRDFVDALDDRITSFYLLDNPGKADIVDGTFEHLLGEKTIIESLTVGSKNYAFEIAPKSFFQTNTSGAEVLYSIVRESVGEGSRIVLDLYAGTGAIGIIVSDLAQKVYSVELVASASEDNIKNLRDNEINNVEVINAKVEDFLQQSSTKQMIELGTIDTIIIDPPRAGMHPSAPEVLPKFGAKKIVYVSCNPSTLARDIEVLCSDGRYIVTDVTPVDMFPHTHHIETVVVLEKC